MALHSGLEAWAICGAFMNRKLPRVAVLWVGKVVLLGLIFMFECFILQEAVLRIEAYDHGCV